MPSCDNRPSYQLEDPPESAGEITLFHQVPFFPWQDRVLDSPVGEDIYGMTFDNLYGPVLTPSFQTSNQFFRDNAREAAWRDRLAPYYRELGLDPNAPVNAPSRAPFNAEMCEVLTGLKPRVASFHFGLPDAPLLARVKRAGCLIFSSATTAGEARWLVEHGADVIIAQGYEAGGHRGMFLTDDLTAQVGTFASVLF